MRGQLSSCKALTAMHQPLPLVSAFITTWNGERYLREAIDSALMQDYPALEVIVVDDGSTGFDGGDLSLLRRSNPLFPSA